ncbi:hypothetical protein PHYC_03795 [Phycisphaerales bacterium]|nr:hypothetical protein PHYC_03795 [Phycisphaerales bacterium]
MPFLPPPLRALLSAYRAANFSLPVLAATLHADPLDLAEQLADPQLAPWLNHLDELDRRERDAADAAHRALAHYALAEIINTPKDAIEKRKAAQTLIRSINTPSQLAAARSLFKTFERFLTKNGAPPPVPPARARGKGHEQPTTPTDTAAAAHSSTSPSPRDSGPKTQDSSTPAASAPASDLPMCDLPFAVSTPAPAFTPTPSSTPHQVVESLLHSLRHNHLPRPNTGLATLLACSDQLTAGNIPVPTDFATLITAVPRVKEPAFRLVRAMLEHTQCWTTDQAVLTDTHATIHLGLKARSAPTVRCTFRLEKRPDSPLPNHWLLTSINSS